MDHTQQPAKSREETSADVSLDISSALCSQQSSDSTHAVFVPLHYECGYAYPLIVWLHGPETDERQLMRIMPLVSIRNYLAVAPRGILACSPEQPDQQRYHWPQTTEHIQQAEERIFAGIEAARARFHVATERVFLVGFDSGGTMALRAAMNHPDQFAGVLSLCGAFPFGQTPLGQLTRARCLPVFLAAGRHSRRYPPETVCDNLRLLHTAGMSVTLRQYPGGHELTAQMLRDMDTWIMEQFTSRPESFPQSDRPWSCPSD